MSEIGSIGEVLELAIIREVQAADFYTALGNRAVDSALKSVLEQLVNIELEHKARLELEMMKEGIVVKPVDDSVDFGLPDYSQELDLAPDAGVADALVVGMEKERRAFRFYVDFAGIVHEEGLHGMLLELAEEEARHLIWLETEYNRLAADRE
jgi:rubrerythrin